MDVIKSSKKFIHIIFLLLLTIQNAFTEMMEKGKTKVKKVFNIYHQNSNDGEQVIDDSGREEANVLEPMIFIEHQINENTAITGQVVFDAWTAASDTKLDSYTGASATPIKGQTRLGANLGVKQEFIIDENVWNYNFNLGFSTEYDYRSINGSFNTSRSFAKNNFTLGLGIQYYSDEVDLFQDIAVPQNSKISTGLGRKIFASNITASQILTPKDIIQVSATFANAKGYLESTANTIKINGVRFLESLPDSRSRYALSSKWVHGFSKQSAFNISYRYYWDQWDMKAHTIRPAILFDIEEDESFIELFTRFHFQDKVKYFSKSFDSQKSGMTSDSDLDRFTSYEIGSFYESSQDDFELLGVAFEEVTWSHSIVYSLRTNGLRYGYYQTGFGYKF